MLQICSACVKQFEINFFNPMTTLELSDLVLRDAGKQGHDGDIAPLAFPKGAFITAVSLSLS